MTTHSSILTWTIPWTEEPSGLQSMGLQRIRHDSATYVTTKALIQGTKSMGALFSFLFI